MKHYGLLIIEILYKQECIFMGHKENNNIFVTLGISDDALRENYDYYATDSKAIDCLLDVMPEIVNQNWKYLEPCAGEGNLSDRFYELTNIKMDTYDIISRRSDIIEGNYFNLDFKDKYDCIITNFPYKESTKNQKGFSDFVVKALKEVKNNGYVISFQKLLQLESAIRYNKIYSLYPPKKIWVFADRISCYRNNDQTLKQGAICYCFCVWKKEDNGFTGPTELDWIKYK